MGTDGLLAFLVRFVSGGLVVALVPVVARQFAPSFAGPVVLVPVVTLLGFYFLGQSQGIKAVNLASGAAILELPALLGFLVTVNLLSRIQQGVGWTMSAALGAWVTMTVPIVVFLIHRR